MLTTFFKNEPRWAKWIILVLGLLSGLKALLDELADAHLIEQLWPEATPYLLKITGVVSLLLMVATKCRDLLNDPLKNWLDEQHPKNQ